MTDICNNCTNIGDSLDNDHLNCFKVHFEQLYTEFFGIEKKHIIDMYISIIILKCCMYGNIDILEYLVNFDEELVNRDWAISNAICNKHYDIATFLINKNWYIKPTCETLEFLFTNRYHKLFYFCIQECTVKKYNVNYIKYLKKLVFNIKI